MGRKPRVRQYAAQSLATLAIENPSFISDIMPSLIACLRDTDMTVRQRATETLGKIGERYPEEVRDAVPFIVKRLGDVDGSVRWCAAYALERIGGAKPEVVKEAVPALIRARKTDPYEHVRWRATYALRRIGVDQYQRAQAADALLKASNFIRGLKRLGGEVSGLELYYKDGERYMEDMQYQKAVEIAENIVQMAIDQKRKLLGES